jgi:hypothetical protein
LPFGFVGLGRWAGRQKPPGTKAEAKATPFNSDNRQTVSIEIETV